MKRLVVGGELRPGQQVPLTGEQCHYLSAVLRMEPGQHFEALDREGNRFVAQLGPGRCRIIGPSPEPDREPSLSVTLYLPLLKGEKLEWVVQKAVELGVSELVLYHAKRAVVKPGNSFAKKLGRWQRIAENATQQCGRSKVPAVTGIRHLSELDPPGIALFAWEGETGGLGQYLNTTELAGPISLLTGPEGGLGEDEVAILVGKGWHPVSLGARILRAETAAIALLTCTMLAGGEMG